MLDATFDDPDLTTFTGLDALGLRITGQRLEPDRAVLVCDVAQDPEAPKPTGGADVAAATAAPAAPCSAAWRTCPFGHRPTTLLLTLVRFVCTGCGRTLRQDTTAAAEPRAKLTRAALSWALRALVVQHLTVARVAEALAVSWHTANDAALAEGQRIKVRRFTHPDTQDCPASSTVHASPPN